MPAIDCAITVYQGSLGSRTPGASRWMTLRLTSKVGMDRSLQDVAEAPLAGKFRTTYTSKSPMHMNNSITIGSAPEQSRFWKYSAPRQKIIFYEFGKFVSGPTMEVMTLNSAYVRGLGFIPLPEPGLGFYHYPTGDLLQKGAVSWERDTSS